MGLPEPVWECESPEGEAKPGDDIGLAVTKNIYKLPYWACSMAVWALMQLLFYWAGSTRLLPNSVNLTLVSRGKRPVLSPSVPSWEKEQEDPLCPLPLPTVSSPSSLPMLTLSLSPYPCFNPSHSSLLHFPLHYSWSISGSSSLVAAFLLWASSSAVLDPACF